LKKGYRFTLIASVIFSVVAMIGGLTIAYYANLKPGATIVTLSVGLLLLMIVYHGIQMIIDKRKLSKEESQKSQE
jgi:zinc transport system permease protein